MVCDENEEKCAVRNNAITYSTISGGKNYYSSESAAITACTNICSLGTYYNGKCYNLS